MSTNKPDIPDRIDQLMVEAATQGLSPQDEAELQAAIQADPLLRDEAEAYELAATVIELSLMDPKQAESLPDALRAKLIESAAAQMQASESAPDLKLSGTKADTPVKPAAFSLTDGRLFGWYAAAAALIALALVLVQPNTGPGQTTPDQQYAAMQAINDTVTASWGFNADGGDERFANAGGEVIWNAEAQAGFMKLTGLPVNDPTKEQYQLWIVDPARDAEPIDGGVFDITASGEVIVPIDAKLRSDSPAVFAITIEQPGGVVVSEGPLQVVAAVDAG